MNLKIKRINILTKDIFIGEYQTTKGPSCNNNNRISKEKLRSLNLHLGT